MAITNLFKRYLEDKWPFGGGSCVLLSMDNLVPVDIYFPDGATVTSLNIYDAEGNIHTITSSNYNRLCFDGRLIIGEGEEAGPSFSVSEDATTFPEAYNTATSTQSHRGFSTGYLIPMFVPSGWRLTKGLKGSVIGQVCAIYGPSYGSIPDMNYPLKYLKYSSIQSKDYISNVNGVSEISCVCQNKGSEPQTFSHIMLLSSSQSYTGMSSTTYLFSSILSSQQNSSAPLYYKSAPNSQSNSNYFSFRPLIPLYYLDDTGVMHRLVQGASDTASYTIWNLWSSLKSNIPLNDYLTDNRYAALPCVTPMIIEELPSPVTLNPDDAYTIKFTLDLSNREAWVRNRSLPEEGLFYYSGSTTGQFPTA